MLQENSKISMGRVFALVSFITIISICIASIILAFYGKTIIIPQELVWVFAVCMGYTTGTKINDRIKQKEEAIHQVI